MKEENKVQPYLTRVKSEQKNVYGFIAAPHVINGRVAVRFSGCWIKFLKQRGKK